MALADALRAGIAVVKTILDDGELLPDVSHEAASGYGRNGEPAFSAAVTRQALVQHKSKQYRVLERLDTGAMGELAISRTQVLFLEDVAIAIGDRITIPGNETLIVADVRKGVLADAGAALQGFVVEAVMR